MRLPDTTYLVIVMVGIAAVTIWYGSAEITGLAAGDSTAQVAYGQYSIKPHFTVKSTHDIGRYKELRIQARQLIDETKRCTGELEPCIESSMKALGLDWQLSCGRGHERIFIDFADTFKRCSESASSDCVCPVETEVDSGIYLITLRNMDGSVIIESPQMQSVSMPGGFSLIRESEGLADFISPAEARISLVKVVVAKASITVNDKETDLGDRIIIYKRGNDLSVLTSESSFRSRPACELTPRRTYAFCVPAGEVTTEGESDSIIAKRQFAFRFALYFEPEDTHNDKTPALPSDQ
jgi:hypothetical protein